MHTARTTQIKCEQIILNDSFRIWQGEISKSKIGYLLFVLVCRASQRIYTKAAFMYSSSASHRISLPELAVPSNVSPAIWFGAHYFSTASQHTSHEYDLYLFSYFSNFRVGSVKTSVLFCLCSWFLQFFHTCQYQHQENTVGFAPAGL